MLKRLTALVVMLTFCGFTFCFISFAGQDVKMRALLVGVERFATQPGIEPAARNNVIKLTQALGQDSRGYQSIRVSLNEAHDERSFTKLIQDSFYGADEDDISLFYITTHGLYNINEPPMTFTMLLSDGFSEYGLTAQVLYEALYPIPGLKVLIIDTCYAGAIIDRGLSGNGLDSLFHGESFKLLTSSGGSEPSFFWSNDEVSFNGGSYFADALLLGISPEGNYAADSNLDGAISFVELHQYLLHNYGVATPFIYPLEDRTVFMLYDKKKTAANPSLITNLELGQSAFSSFDGTLEFSYTLNRPADVQYQLIYQKDQHWQFTDAQIIPESDLFMGRKERMLQVKLSDPPLFGYALLYLVALNGEGAAPHAQTLLTVEAQKGDPRLAVFPMLSSFSPDKGEELPILIRHEFPIRLYVKVKNDVGKTVKVLWSEQATRPSYLEHAASLVYWTGQSTDGQKVAGGLYTIEVSTKVGENLFKVKSAQVRVN